MKLAHLFVSICFASAAFSQVPTSLTKDSLAADSIVFDYAAETDPEFPGGYDKLSKYIGKELKWDEVDKWTAKKNFSENNRIVVRFVVEKDGSLSHVHVESASAYCPPCNKEAIRVIQAMPKWKPGQKNGRPVRTWVRIPIIFNMK